VFWFSLQLLSATFTILRRTERHILKTAYRSSSKVPVLLLDFNEAWIFSTDFRKILKVHKNPPSGRRAVPFEGMGRRTDKRI
jgi:hypothetical protein